MPTLRPYQEVGARFLASRPGALLADEQGLGKTCQAIAALRLAQVQTALIICPAAAKWNWVDELEAWGVGGVGVAEGKTWQGTPIIVTSYDILHNFVRELAGAWDAIILDEAQYICNTDAKRTKRVFTIRAKRKWALTGTPMPNYRRQLYALLRWVAPKQWPSKRDFLVRYCAPKLEKKEIQLRSGRVLRVRSWNLDGVSNTEELTRKMEPVMLRRLKADVLPELPPKRVQSVVLRPGEDISEALEVEREEAAKMLRGGASAADLGALAKARKALGLAKVAPALDFLKELLRTQQKVVIFAHHREVIARLLGGLTDYPHVCITGDTPKKRRREAVKSFQTDPEIRVFVGNMVAAGVAITLTAASVAVFIEQDWTPGVMSQAMDRIHRFGQKYKVLIQFLVFDGSLDARMARSIARKEENINATIKPSQGEQQMSIESILERIAAALENQNSTVSSARVNLDDEDHMRRYGLAHAIATAASLRPGVSEVVKAAINEHFGVEAPRQAVSVEGFPQKLLAFEKTLNAWATEGQGEKAPSGDHAKPAEDAAPWDPLADTKIMAKYSKEKSEAIKAKAAELGIDLSGCKTGADAHKALLKGAEAKGDDGFAGAENATPPVKEDFDFGEADPAPVPPKTYTAEEMRKLAMEYCKAKGAKDIGPVNEVVKEVFKGAKTKFGDLTPDDYSAVAFVLESRMD